MKKSILLSIFSGLLLWIAWPPTPYTTILLFIGFVPMLLMIEDIIHSAIVKKGKHIFWISFVGFFVWNSLSVYWVYNPIKDIGAVVAVPVTLIPYSLAPLLMSTACWFYFRMRLIIPRAWSLVMLVCFWMGYEYLHQSWDLNFPWMTLGNAFAVSHQWVQWYEYTGVYGGTIWIWALNIIAFLLYVGLRESQPKKLRLRLIAVFVLVLAIPLSCSLFRYYNYEEQPDPANIVAAQPNIDPYAKESTTLPARMQLDILMHLSDSIAQPNTEFFLWPETAIAEQTNEDNIRQNPYFIQVQQFLGKYKNGNVLSGIESYKIYDTDKTPTASFIPQSRQYIDNFNAAINIENSAAVQFYHKSRLVPGVEELPFGSALSFMKPVFEQLGGATGSYGSQPEPGVFYSQSGIGVDPVICFESIWGEYVGRSVRKGAQFIAVITNDGWFGNTSGKDQHLLYDKLCAIETRRWVCRSANTGISAFINQRGDIVKQTKWWTRTAIKQDINLNSDLTFYVRYGDYLPKIASILAVLGMLFIIARTRITRKRSVPV